MTARIFLVLLAFLAAVGGIVAAAQSADIVTIAAFLGVGVTFAALATVVPG